MMKTHRILSALFLATTLNSPLHGDEWPCWRGDGGLGISKETNLPASWSREKNVLWKQSLPGWGDSSPIAAGPNVYVTTQTEDTTLHVLALDRRTGSVRWSRQAGKGKLKSHDLHNMATPTPVSDGHHVWALFGTGDLVCLDTSGKEIWRHQLQEEHGAYKIGWGMGTSPVLYQNRLFIACMQSGPSYILALDAKTGRELWKKDRTTGADDEAQDSYSTPILMRVGPDTQLVVAGGNYINAYQPETGDQIWISGGLKVPHAYGRTIAGPAAGNDTVIAVASGWGNRGHLMALKAGGKGDLRDQPPLWTAKKYSPDCPTPLVYQGDVYSIRDDGMASCLDVKSGEPHWQERLFSSNVKISPVAGDGKIYFLNNQANCTVIKAGPRLEVLAENKLDEETLSTPAISDGNIFIRTKEHLFAIGE